MPRELLTVAETIAKLQQFDPAAKVIITNAETGQTFGFEAGDVIQLPDPQPTPIKTIGFKPQNFIEKIVKVDALVAIKI